MHKILKKKNTGLLLPLFSMWREDDFGCGDISSIKDWLYFLKELDLNILQILPINELPPNTNCPYTSLTAFAVDPIYIDIANIENLSPTIKKNIKSKDFKNKIKKIKELNYIAYDEIKRIKYEILWQQYNFFIKEFIKAEPKEKDNFEKYCFDNSWWLDDYALFRRMKDIFNFSSWQQWPDGLRDRKNEEISKFIKENEFEINFFKYIQWEIDKQLLKLKKILQKNEIHLFGDIPFMVNKESADIWSRRHDFNLELESGAPPDAFSKEGQRWGIPAPNWESQINNNFEWWRLKLKKFAQVYDIFRIDHMVGFFRTWVIPINGSKPDFDITDPYQQEERGRKFLTTITKSTHMLAVAEDLGVIPPFVRKVMKELNVPGYKVMRWEKNETSTSYLDPQEYDPISLATTSTHDTEPMKSWWETIDEKEKREFLNMLGFKGEKLPSYSEIKDIINEKLLKSPSKIVISYIPDIISSNERINTPGTVGNHNWNYRIKMIPERFYEKYKRDFDNFKEMVKKYRK